MFIYAYPIILDEDKLYLLLFFYIYIYIYIYSGVFASLIMEVMCSACVSCLFVIGCDSVSVPVTWGLVAVDWTNPSTVLVLFNEQWPSSKLMCRAGLPLFESRCLYSTMCYFGLYCWIQSLIQSWIPLYLGHLYLIYFISCEMKFSFSKKEKKKRRLLR